MRLLRAAQRHGAGRSRSAAHQRCACCAVSATPSAPSNMLARLREALPNARDLNEAFSAIPPGRVIRCANPSSARPEDVEYLLREMRVRDLIDLRAAEEILEDDSGSALMARTVMRSYRRGWLRPGQLFAQPADTVAAAAGPGPSVAGPSVAGPSTAANPSGDGEPPAASTAKATENSNPNPAPPSSSSDDPSPHHRPADPAPAATAYLTVSGAAPAAAAADAAGARVLAVRHNISLLDRGRYYVSLVSRIPATTTAAAILTNFVSKPAARSLLLPYVNGGGLPMLYEMLLESSRPEICRVMEVLLAAAESRHCVMFFCRAGKDRTGLVAAMVLSVSGASEEQIVEDYARSDAYHHVALAGLESREELAGLDRAQFERAPAQVMVATLEHVRRRYGSVADYLTGLGFGPERQSRLRELLTSQW